MKLKNEQYSQVQLCGGVSAEQAEDTPTRGSSQALVIFFLRVYVVPIA